MGYYFQLTFYIYHPTDRIVHTTAFVTPVLEHWLEREIAQWGKQESLKDFNYLNIDYKLNFHLFKITNVDIDLRKTFICTTMEGNLYGPLYIFSFCNPGTWIFSQLTLNKIRHSSVIQNWRYSFPIYGASP